MAVLSSQDKPQRLAQSLDAFSHIEAVELSFMLLKATAKLCMLFVIDTSLSLCAPHPAMTFQGHEV